MSVVVADSGPINYLVLIGEIALLPALHGRVLIPEAVRDELCAAGAPTDVRSLAITPPDWVQVSPALAEVEGLGRLDPGESAAITLALSVKAKLVLMDDRTGARSARGLGLEVIGTLGLLESAARRRLVQLDAALDRLAATNFRVRRELLDALRARHPRGEHDLR